MMEKVQESGEVAAAGKDQLKGWRRTLSDADPELFERTGRYLAAVETAGPLDDRMRHLIWTAVNAVVTHIYPYGLGAHAKLALGCGASLAQLFETLEIAAYVSSRGYAVALPIVLEETASEGLLSDATPRKAKLDDLLGPDWPGWMTGILPDAPPALDELLAIGYGRRADDGLDPRERELILFACNACPAIAERDAIRYHSRRAVRLGVARSELLHALQLANGIGLRAIADGVTEMANRELVPNAGSHA